MILVGGKAAVVFTLAPEVGGGLAAGAATLVYAAFSPESQLFGATVVAGSDPDEAALTYDDGPNERATAELLEILAEHEARATFFMLGKYVRRCGPLVRRVQAAGHVIGNHTENHPWLAWQGAGRVREELRGCQEALEDALGERVRYFRPPHGARRPVVLRAAAELGMLTVQWNAMAQDWRPLSRERMLANLERGMRRARRAGRGANLLLHDGGDRAQGADRSTTLAVTAALLEQFKSRGVRVVTVEAWDGRSGREAAETKAEAASPAKTTLR